MGRDYEVAIADVDEAEANRGAAARRSGLGSPLDVTDPEAVRAAADQLVERCGSVDAWVNNAGILITGLAHEQPIDAYRRQLDVNYLGTVNGTLAAIDRMRPAGRGHIINVISLAGPRPRPDSSGTRRASTPPSPSASARRPTCGARD